MKIEMDGGRGGFGSEGSVPLWCGPSGSEPALKKRGREIHRVSLPHSARVGTLCQKGIGSGALVVSKKNAKRSCFR